MPSSQKTPYLNLNRWSGTDKPKRSDWNSDNDKLDSSIQSINTSFNSHAQGSGLHITQAERDKWNAGKTFSTYNYTGNGSSTRSISLGIKPSFAIVFAVNQPPISNYPFFKCYSGYLSSKGCTDGLELSSNGFVTYHDTAASPTGYAVCLNENNVNYVCIYW